ncbi:gamma-glutamyl-gamma-aminobutyrate hydrolase family protein [Bartonella sp. DGB1]|uniref:glutamine amidotransferase-related protein n=1 Tax=Bartonella sp. DGB1 TaxID=3239807 RepID=UPI0035257683
MILIDHQDSFVYTLANYFSILGQEVIVVRPPVTQEIFNKQKFHLMVLSPGPGTPADFNCNNTIKIAIENNLPIFGICLGLQALVEFYGGKLTKLIPPKHGKISIIDVLRPSIIFDKLPDKIKVGRYHSLCVVRDFVPNCFNVTAVTDDQVIMSIEHKEKNISAVQFHPESILTADNNLGLKMLDNILKYLNRG